MRPLALVSLALLAACERSGGVQFIVEIPADYSDVPEADLEAKLPSEVRLFIGTGEENQDAIAPEGFGATARRSGTYWLRDPVNQNPELDRAPIGVGAPAVFSFGHDGGVDALPVVIAVGYADGKPTSSAAVFHARVGSTNVFQYRMRLRGAADPREPTLRGRENQLEVWGADECIHIDDRRDDIQDSGHRVSFIVGSAEDRDCDGLREDSPKECFPTVHRGEGLLDTPTCLYGGAMTENCTLGVPVCRDGTGPDTSCNPSRFCAPPELCARCIDADRFNCAQDYQTHNQGGLGGYGLTCVIFATRVGTDLALCEQEISGLITPPLDTECKDVDVKSLDDMAFGDQFSLTGPGTATVKVSHNACLLKLEPTGTVVLNATGILSYGALMLVHLVDGRGLAVPVHVKLEPAAACGEGRCFWTDIGEPDNPDACVRSLRP